MTQTDGDAAAAAAHGDDNRDANVDNGDDADDDDNPACDHSTIKTFLGSQKKYQSQPKCLHEASHLTDHPSPEVGIMTFMLQIGKHEETEKCQAQITPISALPSHLQR